MSFLSDDLDLLRVRSPLIHNITNFVVMNNTANALLALGASPVMAHSIHEVADMAAMAGAVVLNIGTLSDSWVQSMLLAGKTANEKGIPVIIDPVGAGATPYRRKSCLQLLTACHPAVIRGNASEIMALLDETGRSKGVDTLDQSSDALKSAVKLALNYRTVVVISGPVDYITDGHSYSTVENGNPLMAKVTGLGCTASALIGAFAAVQHNAFRAAVHGMAVCGLAGERAARTAAGPGTLQLRFLDELYQLSPDRIKNELKSNSYGL